MTRLAEEFKNNIKSKLFEKFQYKNKHQIPKITKIVLNMGIGDAKEDSKILDKAQEELTLIAGQKAIKTKASPRHVPSKIISILDIPKTKNGKLVELAIKQTIEGEAIKNLEALANPDSLKQFENIKELNE